MMRLLKRVAPVLALAALMLFAADRLARRYLQSKLTEHAAGPDAEAVVPDLAQLAERAPIGVEPLAAAAASTDRATALAARDEIEGLIRTWRLAEAERPGSNRDNLRLRLADALLARSKQFTPAGQQWLAGIAIRLVKDSGADADMRLTLACDRLLVASRERAEILDAAPPMPVADSESPKLRSESIAAAAPPLPAPAELWRPNGVRTPSASPLPPRSPRTVRLTGPQPRTTPTPKAQPPEPRPVAIAASARRIPAAPVAARSPTRPAAELPWQRPSGSPTPVTTASRSGWGPSSLVSPVGVSLALVAALPDRVVLQVGLQQPTRLTHTAIVARGFGRSARVDLVAAVTGELSDRQALAERLGSDRSAASARLLLLLASDPAPQVRRAAIQQLGLSGSPVLERAAIKMAVRDPDPRVAALADELLRR
ncbi:MAG: hypothetical protein AAGJ46_14975 [Planctomycetota bacterium]